MDAEEYRRRGPVGNADGQHPPVAGQEQPPEADAVTVPSAAPVAVRTQFDPRRGVNAVAVQSTSTGSGSAATTARPDSRAGPSRNAPSPATIPG